MKRPPPAGNPAGTDFSDAVTLTIPASDADRLSLVMVLVCTNDGFTGLDGVPLPTGIDGTADLDPVVHGWTEPAATVTVTAQGDGGGVRSTDRLWGNSRIETAVAISQRAFPDSAPVVYLANAENNVDAVVGGTLIDGPILLVPFSGDLPAVVRSEIQRLDPDQVIALGGSAVVSQAMLDAAAAS